MPTQPTIRFAAIGLNHGHIYGQVNLLLRAGAEFVSFYAKEPELIGAFIPKYPQAWLADVLARLPYTMASRVPDLLPWNWSRTPQRMAA